MFHVEREAFLRAVGPDEMRRQATHALIVAAREVAGLGAFDLDDARTKVSQLARGERRRDRVFQRDDGDALEWLHAVPRRLWRVNQRTTAVASIVSQPSWSEAQRWNGLAVGLRVAADVECVQVEGRPHGFEPEARDVCIGHALAQQVHQKRGDQRAVHDQAGVALDLRHILSVVVDTVAIERERGVPEQQNVVGHDVAAPRCLGRRRLRRGHDVVGALCLAVNDVVEFDQRRFDGLVAAQFVAYLDEHQLAGTPLLDRNVVDRGGSSDAIAHADRGTELELAARPHAPRQRNRGKEGAALGVAVRTDFALAMHRQEVEPMPKRREGVADSHRRGRVVERRGKCDHGRGVDDVFDPLGAPDPGLQLISRCVHFASFTGCAKGSRL